MMINGEYDWVQPRWPGSCPTRRGRSRWQKRFFDWLPLFHCILHFSFVLYSVKFTLFLNAWNFFSQCLTLCFRDFWHFGCCSGTLFFNIWHFFSFSNTCLTLCCAASSDQGCNPFRPVRLPGNESVHKEGGTGGQDMAGQLCFFFFFLDMAIFQGRYFATLVFL